MLRAVPRPRWQTKKKKKQKEKKKGKGKARQGAEQLEAVGRAGRLLFLTATQQRNTKIRNRTEQADFVLCARGPGGQHSLCASKVLYRLES